MQSAVPPCLGYACKSQCVAISKHQPRGTGLNEIIKNKVIKKNNSEEKMPEDNCCYFSVPYLVVGSDTLWNHD